MTNSIHGIKLVRVSCNIARAFPKYSRSDINQYLSECYWDVLHMFDFSECKNSGLDFIVMAFDDLDTVQIEMSDIVSSEFPGVDVKVSQYFLF